MIDKVQKIRNEVERLQNELIQEREKGYGSDVDDACSLELQNVLTYIESLQEESVSEDLEEAAKHYLYSNILYDDVYVGNPTDKDCIEMFKAGAKWQKTQDESTTEDLGEYIYELSKRYPEVSFAKLSRIAVRVAKWKEGQLKKNRLEHFDALTKEEAQREYDFVTGIIKNEHRIPTFDDAIKYGMMLQKEQMMKDAIECKVDWYDGFLLDYTQEQQDELLEKIGADVGDKVKVIVIRED